MQEDSKKLRILIDLDAILVDMLQPWLDLYNQKTGESHTVENIYSYNLSKTVKHYDILEDIVKSKGFFADLPPMPHGPETVKKLMKKHDVVIVTQLPRSSNFAAQDKRKWILEHLGADFDLQNVIFAHRKELIDADIIFDDRPRHLAKWKKAHPNGISAKITYNYNYFIETDWTFDEKETAWQEFYKKITYL